MFLPMLGSFILGTILVVVAILNYIKSKKLLYLAICVIGIILIIFATYLAIPK